MLHLLRILIHSWTNVVDVSFSVPGELHIKSFIKENEENILLNVEESKL